MNETKDPSGVYVVALVDGRHAVVAPPFKRKRGRPKRVEPWPWEVLGLTRTTYYRLKKLGKLPSGGTEA